MSNEPEYLSDYDPTEPKVTKNLKYHRDLAAAVFGPDSPAVAFLDSKIARYGGDEEVIIDEGQLILLLQKIHKGDIVP